MLGAMAEPNPEVSQPFEPLPPPAGSRNGRRRILLVEDDLGDALLVEVLLARSWPELEVIGLCRQTLPYLRS